MNKAFGSSMTGDISWFAGQLQERKVSLSFTVDDGFHFDDPSQFRVLHQVEPPEVLNVVDKIIANHKFYDLILGWNEKVLANCSNAVFLPEAVCSWLGRKREKGSVYQACDVYTKQFAVSFITSNKTFCPGHKLRCEIYDKLPEYFGNLKVIKHMSPPRWPDKRTIIEPYQFHIGVENAMHNNWFADKIVDAFIGKAIPLYWGCPNLERYFNMEGVIRFSDYSELERALKCLTPEFYHERLGAVEDNFNRAMKYVHTWDRIEEEITAGIARKERLKLEHENVRKLQAMRIKRPLCTSQ